MELDIYGWSDGDLVEGDTISPSNLIVIGSDIILRSEL